MIWPDGSVHWLVARARVFVGDSGEPVHMIGVNLDITDRKRSEQALCEANEQLQQFASAASHDLQEPLRTITSYTQLLARRYKGQLDGDADELIQFVLQGTGRMGGLVKALLSFSRAGSIEPEPAWLRLDDVIAKVRKDLELAITEAGAEITYSALPAVFADATQFHQLMQNLIANALKYRSATKPRVHIRASRKISNGLSPSKTMESVSTRSITKRYSVSSSVCMGIPSQEAASAWQRAKGSSSGTTVASGSVPRSARDDILLQRAAASCEGDDPVC